MLRKPDRYASRCAIPGIRSSFDEFDSSFGSAHMRAPNLYPKSGQCPIGLEPLENIEHIFLKKHDTDVVFNVKNNYIIRNAKGLPIYRILETTYDGIGMVKLLTGSSPSKQFPHPSLTFVVNGEDGKEVFEIKACPSGINVVGQHHQDTPKVSVRYHGQLVGKIVQQPNMISNADGSTTTSTRKTILGIPLRQTYQIYDAYDRLLLKLKIPDSKSTSRQSSVTNPSATLGLIGPSLSLVGTISGSNDYHIFPPDVFSTHENRIGKISKYWGSLTRDYFSTVDTPGVKFPAKMDVKTKALLMAMMLMLDIQFFEHS